VARIEPAGVLRCKWQIIRSCRRQKIRLSSSPSIALLLLRRCRPLIEDALNKIPESSGLHWEAKITDIIAGGNRSHTATVHNSGAKRHRRDQTGGHRGTVLGGHVEPRVVTTSCGHSGRVGVLYTEVS
jgi:hypothetical protein